MTLLNLAGSAGWVLPLVLMSHPLACAVALVMTGLCSTAGAVLALPNRRATLDGASFGQAGGGTDAVFDLISRGVVRVGVSPQTPHTSSVPPWATMARVMAACCVVHGLFRHTVCLYRTRAENAPGSKGTVSSTT